MSFKRRESDSFLSKKKGKIHLWNVNITLSRTGTEWKFVSCQRCMSGGKSQQEQSKNKVLVILPPAVCSNRWTREYLEVNGDNVNELGDSYSQELTIDEFIEMS